MIARMRYINRWGLMRNTDLENIQEHSHMVAVLAHALAVIENEKFGGHVDPGAVAVAAGKSWWRKTSPGTTSRINTSRKIRIWRRRV